MRLDGTEYGDIDYAIFKARTRQAMVLKYPKFYLKGLKNVLAIFFAYSTIKFLSLFFYPQ